MAKVKKAQGAVPRLRFPGFEGAWKHIPLARLASRATVRNSDAREKRVLTNSAERGIIDQRDYFDKDIADKDNLQAYYVVDEGDYVYNPRISNAAPVGPISKNMVGKGVMSPLYTVFRIQSPTADFFAHYFKSNRWHGFLRGNSSTGARHDRMSISADAFMQMPVPDIDPVEQSKVSDCLFFLDADMGAETRKLEALKVHKQGLMRQLFPAESERLPRLRFPGFEGEWDEVALGDIAEIKLGKMLDSNKHRTGNVLSYLNNLSVRWNEIDTSSLPQMYFDEDELDRFGLKAGDVVVCEGGEPGRSAVWDGRLPDIKFQKAVHRVRFNIPFEPHLLVLYLESVAGTPQFEKLFTGGGIKHLTRETFARLKIPMTSYVEQRCIVNCLSSLDSLIAAQSRKIAMLQQHKKGLMQGLFPVVEMRA